MATYDYGRETGWTIESVLHDIERAHDPDGGEVRLTYDERQQLEMFNQAVLDSDPGILYDVRTAWEVDEEHTAGPYTATDEAWLDGHRDPDQQHESIRRPKPTRRQNRWLY